MYEGMWLCLRQRGCSHALYLVRHEIFTVLASVVCWRIGTVFCALPKMVIGEVESLQLFALRYIEWGQAGVRRRCITLVLSCRGDANRCVMALLLKSSEYQEAMRAFLEKRAPVYEDR